MKFLIQFTWRDRLLDFRVAEVLSTARTLGIEIYFLDSEGGRRLNVDGDDRAERANAVMKHDECFVWVELPSVESARQVAGRSVTIKSIVEVFAVGDSYASLNKSILRQVGSGEGNGIKGGGGCADNGSRILDCLNGSKSVKFQVESFGRNLSHGEQLAIINQFNYLHFTAPVDLKNPETVLSVLEDYEMDPRCSYYLTNLTETLQRKINALNLAKADRSKNGNGNNGENESDNGNENNNDNNNDNGRHENNEEEGENDGISGREKRDEKEEFTLRRIYFGLQIAVGNRAILSHYRLPNRDYLGTTSMPPELLPSS